MILYGYVDDHVVVNLLTERDVIKHGDQRKLVECTDSALRYYFPNI